MGFHPRSQGSGLGGAGDSGGALGSFYSYTIDQSLRFVDGSSSKLTRTPGSAGNRRTFTFSCWVKRSTISADQALITAGADAQNRFQIYFLSNDKFGVYGNTSNSDKIYAYTDAVFRDVSAWYNVVVAIDSTDGTAGNRLKMYVNGVEQTYTYGTTPSQDEDFHLNNTVAQAIGSDAYAASNLFDGYLAEMHLVDGTALTASSFGETKDGVWIPKEYSGSHGTNGFYLPMGETATSGFSADFDGSGDNVRFTNASQYDIASDDDFCLELYAKGDFESNYSYGIGDYTNSYFLLQLGANGVVYGYYGNGQSNILGDMTAHLSTTDWHHIAYVRESGTYRLYIDGVQRGTGTGGGTAAHDSARFDIGDAHESAGAPHFNGKISNLRFTVGAARYGSGTTFTVPTSTLTNDSSNVKLLAFTTSSITADGSSAGVTATISEGDPVFSTDSPFSALIGDDASSNTNDFTHSGIDFHDIVPDSPTKNFATMNSLMIGDARVHSSAVYSEGNLKVLGGGFSTSTIGGGYSTIAIPKDKKIYMEVCETVANGVYWSAGIIIDNHVQNSTQVGGNGSIAVYNRSAQINGVETDYGASAGLGGLGVAKMVAGDVLGVAVDGATGKCWFHRNGTYLKTPSTNNSGTTGNPSAGTNELGTIVNTTAINPSGEIFFFIGNHQDSDNCFVNFGQDSTFAGNKTAGTNTDANGEGLFQYAVPTDYVCLHSGNMSDITIGPTQSTQADDHFNTVLWTGNSTAGRAISGVGFQPDWVWVKERGAANNHILSDSVRGATKGLHSDSSTQAEFSDVLASFNTDGFVVSDHGTVNNNSDTYVAWNWKAGTAFSNDASATSIGSIDSTGSVSTEAGFSIISYTGTGAAATVAHGLGAVPTVYICKARTDTGGDENFLVYHHANTSAPETDYLLLNSNQATEDSDGAFNDTAPTSTVFSIGSFVDISKSGVGYIAYVFTDIEGFSKHGLYKGNGSADGTFVYTGFRPAWIMQKKTNNSGHWHMWDSTRNTSNEVTRYLLANANNSEYTDGGLDILSNGFKPRKTGTGLNADGDTYVFLAFAEQPFKFSNAR